MRNKVFIVLFWLLTCIHVQAQNPIIQSIINDVSIDSLMLNANQISGEVGVTVDGVIDTIFSRNRSKPGNELSFKYIRDKFISYGYQVDSMTFGSTGGKNIWAIKPGLLYPNEPVIICGHYDAMPASGNIAPAADDDGSGVAAVLEAARVLSGYNFEYTILFALWDEEEYGLAGSAAYAQNALNNNDTIHAVFNMDAIAHDSDNDSVARVHARPPGNSEEIADTVVAINANYNVGLDLILVNPGATYSDHASFWNRNFGAVLLIQDWEGDPNPHYHLISDKVQYFNIPYFHKLARLAIGSTAAFAVPFSPGAAIHMEDYESIRIYPNPTYGMLNVKWNYTYDEVVLTDILGKTIISRRLTGEKDMMFDLTGYDDGIYFLYFLHQGKKTVKKLIKR